jgi:hypothetical protein
LQWQQKGIFFFKSSVEKNRELELNILHEKSSKFVQIKSLWSKLARPGGH